MASIVTSERGFKWFLLLPALGLLGLTTAFALGTIVSNSLTLFVPGTGADYSTWTLGNYRELFTDPYYWRILARTLRVACVTAALCALFGFPVAVYISRQRGGYRAVLTALIIAPLFINLLVRVFGWYILLGREGLVVQALSTVMETPPRLMYTEAAVIVGMVQSFLPMMIIFVLASIEQIDKRIVMAADDLGARGSRIFWGILLPLSIPGIIAGSVLIFTLAVGQFAVPVLLGGNRIPVLSYTAYEYQILQFNWPMGSAVVVVMMIAIALVLGAYGVLLKRNGYIRRITK
jgi:putative spermidine/putrescine transport system permease protein